MKSRQSLIIIGCFLVALIAGATLVVSKNAYFSLYPDAIEEQLAVAEHRVTSSESSPSHSVQVVEKVITSAQLWRPVQERVKDTVVQVFSQIAAIDLLQPYKTPNQGSACGSGFFINDKGELITNAHVINQAKAVWIQIPSLGKRIIDVDLVGVSPDRDLALLRVTPECLDMIKHELGAVPHLPLGDSDLVYRSDDTMALGYPLGQQSLKSTTGVISGREQHYLQISAPINPGSSGGPLLNAKGEVIGINSAGIMEAQSVGYAIPINDLTAVLPDLYKTTLLRKPYLGVLFSNATEALTEYLGNPAPGGCYVVDVIKNSTLDKAGVQSGDMIYAINSNPVDMYGEMQVPWSEDKISVIDYVSRLPIGKELSIVVYRQGIKKEFKTTFDMTELPAIREIYPGLEDIDYEVIAGMVIMPLALNHLPLLGQHAPGLAKFVEGRNQSEPVLVVTHIFPSSHIYRSRTIQIGSTINEISGMPARTLAELRQALKTSATRNFLTLRISDNVSRKSDNILVALPWKKIIEEEPRLAADYRYPLSEFCAELIQNHKASVMLAEKTNATHNQAAVAA